LENTEVACRDIYNIIFDFQRIQHGCDTEIYAGVIRKVSRFFKRWTFLIRLHNITGKEIRFYGYKINSGNYSDYAGTYFLYCGYLAENKKQQGGFDGAVVIFG
jgi:hypothetical protein